MMEAGKSETVFDQNRLDCFDVSYRVLKMSTVKTSASRCGHSR